MEVPYTSYHLSYCTNIHPGETWQDTFKQLKEYLPKVKEACSPEAPMGIGLRLSNQASVELADKEILANFIQWLKSEHLYVFTMNGFPYGDFHGTVVKDNVHSPDWTTQERFDYTLRLFEILNKVMPTGLHEGSISTSPLSYKYWHTDKKEIFSTATIHLIQIAQKLYKIKQKTGRLLHLDLEPEPDGLLENTKEVIKYYCDYLLPIGEKMLANDLNVFSSTARQIILDHIRICYDVCHYAIEFESPEEAIEKMNEVGIKLGKIQISAALQADFDNVATHNKQRLEALKKFEESTYLHQVIVKGKNGLRQYQDLPQALKEYRNDPETWRIHFHVPLFLENYEPLQSTNKEIIKTLEYLKDKNLVKHLEIETYTWDVLPKRHQLPLSESIIREMQWVLEKL